MKIDVNSPEAELSKLLAAVERGEEVELVRDGVALANVTPIEKRRKRDFVIPEVAAALSKGPAPDFLEPMTEEELRLWEGR